MDYSSFTTNQLYIFGSLIKLRRFNSPLVQGANIKVDEEGLLVNVKRTCRGEPEFLDPLEKYFERASQFPIIMKSFNELNGDLGMIFEDGTTIDFIRKIDEEQNVLGPALFHKPYVCGIERLEKMGEVHYCYDLSSKGHLILGNLTPKNKRPIELKQQF